jgi:MSHA pilin protein MshA
MKKNQGFTLVELVIVIVILGILAVTAAPRFLDLAGDARISTLEAVQGSLQSANALVFSKSILQTQNNLANGAIENPDIAVVFGFPAATVDVFNAILELDGADWTIIDSTSAPIAAPADNQVVITPDEVTYTTVLAEACQLIYTEAAAPNARPTIVLQTDGC